jgi:hypothetical protein
MASEATLRRRPHLALVVCLLAGCAGDGIRRFPLRDPVWVDPDTHPIASKPAKRKTAAITDGYDQMVLRPLSRATKVPVRQEALNVNSLDEVPNSSWFTNRIGVRAMTTAEVARGACGETPPLNPDHGPWVIVSGKADGANPGFVIKAPDGFRYLIKLDGELRGQRPTAADVIGSKLYHAFGFNTPCNEIVYFREGILKLDPSATRDGRYGQTVPMSPADVDTILGGAWRRADGSLRAVASRYLPGSPLGPFRYEGIRRDDPNDVIPHEKRRELRGSMLLAAWIHHWDAREQNTLDMLVDDQGRKFVRHHLLDWGDSLGHIWNREKVNRRTGIGRSGYFDLDHMLVDFVTLGLYPRPWYRAYEQDEPETFPNFGTAAFVPSQWRGTYGNAAFLEMTPRDALWATRIVARFSDDHIRAIVAEAKLEEPRLAAYLTKTLIDRRDAILREYLTAQSPLASFSVQPGTGEPGQAFCFQDLAIATRVADPRTTVYRVHVHGGAKLERLLGWTQLRPSPDDPARTCVKLPPGPLRGHSLAGARAADDHPLRYTLIELYTNQHPSVHATSSVLVHLYDLGPQRGFRLVGIERPYEVRDPP